MAENKGFDILDYIVFLAKWKKILLAVFAVAIVVTYVAIYFGVREEFESSALIVPYSDSQSPSVSGLMKNLKELPMGLGGSAKSDAINLFSTIIYSTGTLEHLIDKFNLMNDYRVKNRDIAVKLLSKDITAGATEENAFRITIRTKSAKKSAAMVNYLVSYLDATIKKYDLTKSRNNREFLEKQYAEINTKLNHVLCEQ